MTLEELISSLPSVMSSDDMRRKVLAQALAGQSPVGMRLHREAIVGALRNGRPVGLMPEGDIATVKMGTFGVPGGYVNAPTYWGQDIPDSHALDVARRNNYPMPLYETEKAAETAAIENSRKTGGAYRWPGYGLRMHVNPVEWNE